MKKHLLFALFAVFAFAMPAFAQHNGTEHWKASQFVTWFSGNGETFLAFRSAARLELVPVSSGFVNNGEFVLKTRTGIRTVGVLPGVALVTHSDEGFHARILEQVMAGPGPTATVEPQTLETYFVDDLWMVHKVTTTKKTRETRGAWVRRHAENLKDYCKAFPPNKENTKEWALARAPHAKPHK